MRQPRDFKVEVIYDTLTVSDGKKEWRELAIHAIAERLRVTRRIHFDLLEQERVPGSLVAWETNAAVAELIGAVLRTSP